MQAASNLSETLACSSHFYSRKPIFFSFEVGKKRHFYLKPCFSSTEYNAKVPALVKAHMSSPATSPIITIKFYLYKHILFI